MSVTEEEGGRLNAFAKEPEIEVVSQKGSITNKSQLIIIIGVLLLGGCIAIAIGVS